MTPQPASSLDDIVTNYAAVLCDVWGVVHNGVDAFADASAALRRAREAGRPVILLTNSPRPAPGVAAQLDLIGVDRQAWDDVVTSGDVTRGLIADMPRRVFHLGPERDLVIFDGLDIELVEEFEAGSVVCTGLFDDENETPDDYAELLQRLRSRNLPFVCANPDIVVERGDRLIWCAGALARDFAQLGGRTLIAGKPHRPIYALALQRLAERMGRTVDPGEVLAIGDGVLTDVKGAADNGMDVLYISGGIHAREYADGEGSHEDRMRDFLKGHGYSPVATMPRLG